MGEIVGWFMVDKVIVEADEHFNRDHFEKEVATLIDAQKAQVKAEYRKNIDSMINNARNKTPLELIRGKG